MINSLGAFIYYNVVITIEVITKVCPQGDSVTPSSNESYNPPLNNSPPITPPTNLKKELVNSLLTVNKPSQTASKLASKLASEPTLVLGIRVPYSYYLIYNRKLSGEQKELVREALKQFFVNLVSNVNEVEVNQDLNFNFNININVNQNVNQESKEDLEVSLLKERLELYEKKLSEYKEILDEYKSYKDKYESVKRLVNSYRNKVIDTKTLIDQLLKVI